jgi:hypothetical protein
MIFRNVGLSVTELHCVITQRTVRLIAIAQITSNVTIDELCVHPVEMVVVQVLRVVELKSCVPPSLLLGDTVWR